MEFEWAPEKAARNLRKHKISFSEAVTVFGDPLSITTPHPDHSGAELRYITVGWSARNRLLLVAHADRGDVIRIISARRLTRSEQRAHEEIEI